MGKEIITAIDEEKTSDIYEFIFDTSNLATGIYLYKLESANFISTKKLLLIKLNL